MRQREKLYGEFIAECAKLFIDAFTHTLDDPEKLLTLYALTIASASPHRSPFSRKPNVC